MPASWASAYFLSRYLGHHVGGGAEMLIVLLGGLGSGAKYRKSNAADQNQPGPRGGGQKAAE